MSRRLCAATDMLYNREAGFPFPGRLRTGTSTSRDVPVINVSKEDAQTGWGLRAVVVVVKCQIAISPPQGRVVGSNKNKQAPAADAPIRAGSACWNARNEPRRSLSICWRQSVCLAGSRGALRIWCRGNGLLCGSRRISVVRAQGAVEATRRAAALAIRATRAGDDGLQ